MTRHISKKAAALIGAAALVIAGGATAAAAAGGGDGGDHDQPITGSDLDRASEAALAETGVGEVTGTEVGDEESLYEVEVTLPDGRQVDVQLDEQFDVVGSKTDHEDDGGEKGDGS